MHHRLLLAAGLGLLIAGSAVAQPTGLDAAFGGTIISTYPSGRSTKLWLNRDGSYDAQRTNGKRTAGKWSRKGEQLCLRQTKPAGLPLTFCSPIPSGGVGARWSSKSPKGEPLKNLLSAGRSGQ